MFKQIFFAVLAASSFALSGEDVDKLDAGCKPCAPCPPRCPEATALQAAALLVNNMCTIINNKDVVGFQTLLTPKATIQMIAKMDGVTCQDSGVVPFLNFAIPALPIFNCFDNSTIYDSYVDSKGRVIVFENFELDAMGNPMSTKAQYTFEPVGASCEFHLKDLLVRDVNCISPAP